MKIVVGLHDQSDRKDTETFTAKRIVAHPQYNRIFQPAALFEVLDVGNELTRLWRDLMGRGEAWEKAAGHVRCRGALARR